MLYHFSEDPTIERFEPHVPATNPTHVPAVWAIDEGHAPLYWFPRECPRVAAWPHDDDDGRAIFAAVFCTNALRFHAIEIGWLCRMQTTRLFRYTFDPVEPLPLNATSESDPEVAFEPSPDATGQWNSLRSVEPTACEPVGDLVELHADAGIELRLVPSLLPLAELANDERWDFSLVRLHNAVR